MVFLRKTKGLCRIYRTNLINIKGHPYRHCESSLYILRILLIDIEGPPTLLLQFRIAHSGMIDRLESFDEHLLCHRHITERDRAILKEALAHLPVDYPVHEFADARLRILWERTGVKGFGPGYVKSASSTGSSGCSFLYDT